MKERPILFSAPMVRAILEGRKTQTRRIVKPRPGTDMEAVLRNNRGEWPCPYGSPGDRLWVRETHAQFAVGEGLDSPVPQCVAYRATCDEDGGFDYVNGRDEIARLKVTKWTPAIHMPRWASRLELDVTGVRVERLNAITEEDAWAEGVDPFLVRYPSFGADQCIEGDRVDEKPFRTSFVCLWDEINGNRALFSSNPWVWVVEFKRVTAEREAGRESAGDLLEAP